MSEQVSIRRAILLTLLLFLELEYILSEHYALRTALREAVGLPLYHIFLGLITFGIFFAYFNGRFPRESFRQDFCWLGWLVNIFAFSGVYWAFPQLLSLGHRLQSQGLLALWSGIFGGLVLSWMYMLAAPLSWLAVFRRSWWGVGLSFVFACLTPKVIAESNQLWRPLGWTTFSATKWVLSGYYDSVYASPGELILGVPGFYLEILPGCSGYEGIGLVSLFVLLYLWVRKDKLSFPIAFLLLPISWTLAWFANVVRLALLVFIGSEISASVAVRGFHSQAGWVAFVLICFVLLWCTERWRLFLPAISPVEQSSFSRALPYVVPQVVWLLALMVSQALYADLDLLYPLRALFGALVVFHYRYIWWQYVKAPTWRGYCGGIVAWVFWSSMVEVGEGVSPFVVLTTASAWGWCLARMLGSSLVVPLIEELAFRGYLMVRLDRGCFEPENNSRVGLKGALLSSIAFGALHSEVVPAFLCGLVFAWASGGRGRLTDAIVAHGMVNFLISLQVLMTARWDLW